VICAGYDVDPLLPSESIILPLLQYMPREEPCTLFLMIYAISFLLCILVSISQSNARLRYPELGLSTGVSYGIGNDEGIEHVVGEDTGADDLE
jgi:hypothetical protein